MKQVIGWNISRSKYIEEKEMEARLHGGTRRKRLHCRHWPLGPVEGNKLLAEYKPET